MKFNGSSTLLFELASGSDVQELTDYSTADVSEVNPHEDADDPPGGPDWSLQLRVKKFDNSGYIPTNGGRGISAMAAKKD